MESTGVSVTNKRGVEAKSMLTVKIKMACSLYDIEPHTLRNLCIRGEIPARKIGRLWYVDTKALDEYMRPNRNG